MNAKTPRQVPEREFALALVLELAHSNFNSVSLTAGYDDDEVFIEAVRKRLDVVCNDAFRAKLIRAARALARVGALEAEMKGTHKEYVGEPSKMMVYSLPPGKAGLILKGETEFTGPPDWEAQYLMRRAYPLDSWDD